MVQVQVKVQVRLRKHKTRSLRRCAPPSSLKNDMLRKNWMACHLQRHPSCV